MLGVCENRLIGITYAEFDNKEGPKLLFQYPPNALCNDDFEAVSDYVIVGNHLCGKIIAVKCNGIQFLNFCVAIENAKYHRNALLFAVGFVLSEDADTDVYEPALRKLSSTLHTLELECEYLFNADTKGNIAQVLQTAYEGLVARKEASVRFDEANILYLSLHRTPEAPPTIQDYDVPMFIKNPSLLRALPLDISVERIIPHINGHTYVKQVAIDADVDIDICKRCLRVLLFYEHIILSDIFHFSNVYITTPDALELRKETSFPEIEIFAALSPHSPPTRLNVFRLTMCASIGNIIASQPELVKGIDILRLLGILQHLKLIRRVQEYPIIKDNVTISMPLAVDIDAHYEQHPKSSLTIDIPRRNKKSHESLCTKNVTLGAETLGMTRDEIACKYSIKAGTLDFSKYATIYK